MKHSKDTLDTLEIFWNSKSKNVRSKLTDFLAAYIETGDIADSLFNIKMNLFNLGMVTLKYNGLVTDEIYNGTTVWSLTPEGHIALLRRHPRLKVIIENFIESTPALVVIASGIVGFVASVAGIIQFYDWLFPKK